MRRITGVPEAGSRSAATRFRPGPRVFGSGIGGWEHLGFPAPLVAPWGLRQAGAGLPQERTIPPRRISRDTPGERV